MNICIEKYGMIGTKGNRMNGMLKTGTLKCLVERSCRLGMFARKSFSFGFAWNLVNQLGLTKCLPLSVFIIKLKPRYLLMWSLKFA